jgi:hypothetical protein
MIPAITPPAILLPREVRVVAASISRTVEDKIVRAKRAFRTRSDITGGLSDEEFVARGRETRAGGSSKVQSTFVICMRECQVSPKINDYDALPTSALLMMQSHDLFAVYSSTAFHMISNCIYSSTSMAMFTAGARIEFLMHSRANRLYRLRA